MPRVNAPKLPEPITLTPEGAAQVAALLDDPGAPSPELVHVLRGHPYRPTWDAYFMTIAAHASTRATCPLRQVGAVLVAERRILATGYNGSPAGLPHCLDVGCMPVPGYPDSCERTVHAEANALTQAARRGVSVQGATLYVTCRPCWRCFGLLVNAGIRAIAYRDHKDDPRVFEAAKALGLLLLHLPGP